MIVTKTNGQMIEGVIIHLDSIKTTMKNKDILILHHAGITRRVDKKRVIHITDSTIKYMYFLQKGLMKISNVNDEGEEVIKYFVKPGKIFGELNLLENEEDRHELAIAMEDCEVGFIPVETVKHLMASDHSFRQSVNLSISKRIKKMEERIFSLSLKSVKERILDFLKEFVLEFGHPVNGGYAAKMFVTHKDIAKITSTSRQSVTTSLVYFKKQGLINYDSQNLSVFKFQHS